MKATLLVLLGACTTLGPMPATTAISPIPVGRPGVETQVGAVPAFFLSRSAQDQAKGTPVLQLSALVEPDRWIQVPGLIVGARLYGQDKDTPGEPYVGYRRKLGDLSVAGVAYGTSKRSTRTLASYHATRLGAELAGDLPIWTPASWFGLHAQLAVAATRIFASGSYCVDPLGIAKDCDVQTPANNTTIEGHLDGVFPAATATIAFDFARNSTGMVQSTRLAVLAATGQMPLLENGVQTATGAYTTLGMVLTVGLGAAQ